MIHTEYCSHLILVVNFVVRVTCDFKASLPHCLLKHLLERRRGQRANYFSSPSDPVLELWSEFNGQLPEPSCDTIQRLLCRTITQHLYLLHGHDPHDELRINISPSVLQQHFTVSYI